MKFLGTLVFSSLMFVLPAMAQDSTCACVESGWGYDLQYTDLQGTVTVLGHFDNQSSCQDETLRTDKCLVDQTQKSR